MVARAGVPGVADAGGPGGVGGQRFGCQQHGGGKHERPHIAVEDGALDEQPVQEQPGSAEPGENADDGPLRYQARPPGRQARAAGVAGIGGQEAEHRAGPDPDQLEDGPDRAREQHRAEPGQRGRGAHALRRQVVAAENGGAGGHEQGSDGEYGPRHHGPPEGRPRPGPPRRRGQERGDEQRQREVAPGD